jgi:hypothetical protein
VSHISSVRNTAPVCIGASIDVATIREAAESALVEINGAELLTIAAITAPEKRLRDLDARAELWRRNVGPKFDLIVSQIRASTGSARSALRAEMLALYQPQAKIDAKIKRLLARRGDAIDAARERYRVERRAIRRRVREAEKSEAARAEQERLDAIRRAAAARVTLEERERAQRRAAEKEARRIEAQRRAAERAEREAARLAHWPRRALAGAS